MKLADLNARNEAAISKAKSFRAEYHPRHFGLIDQLFHQHKNHFPFHGFVPVTIRDTEFVMFCGNDDLIALTFFWHGPNSYEVGSLETWLAMARDASCVLDVGAFSGVYALCAASASPTSTVVAFEPSRRTHGRLLLNTYVNQFERRIRCVNNAVSDKVSQLRLLQFRGENILGNGASILEKGVPTTDTTEFVDTVVLDQFCAENELKPDLLKIDVEGAETLVLQGMQEILSAFRPRFLLEVTPKTARDVKPMLERHGYKSWVIDDTTGDKTAFDGSVPKVSNLFVTPD